MFFIAEHVLSIVTLVIPSSILKALEPIFVTVFGIVILFKLQPPKVYAGIDVSLFPNTKSPCNLLFIPGLLQILPSQSLFTGHVLIRMRSSILLTVPSTW